MADPPGISLALDDAPLEGSPTWTRLDTSYRIPGYSIRRGRQDEFDRTQTGVASFGINDLAGTYNPITGFDIISCPAAISLHNPVTSTWHTIFRGMVDRHSVDLHPAQVVNDVTIDLVDGLDYLANHQLRFNVNGAWQPPFTGDWEPGNIVYEYDPDNTVDARINQVLDEVGWDATTGGAPGGRSVFTGNVHLQRSIYTAGTSVLTVIDEAADAEFPGIANRFVSKVGAFVFHGRLARFNPFGGEPYGITQWKLGDGFAIAGDSEYAQARPPFTAERSREHVLNSILITPAGVTEDFWNTMLVEDLTSIDRYGVKSFSAESLRIHDSVLTGNDAVDECILYATYYKTVYSTPQTRVNQVVVRSLPPTDPRAAKTWKLLCEVEISDIITLSMTQAGGGTLEDDYFVEGISYDVRPLQPEYADVTMTLDLSPRTWFDFPWT